MTVLYSYICKCFFLLWRLDIEFCISVSVEKCISFAELLHLYCGGAGVESFGGWRLE